MELSSESTSQPEHNAQLVQFFFIIPPYRTLLVKAILVLFSPSFFIQRRCSVPFWLGKVQEESRSGAKRTFSFLGVERLDMGEVRCYARDLSLTERGRAQHKGEKDQSLQTTKMKALSGPNFSFSFYKKNSVFCFRCFL